MAVGRDVTSVAVWRRRGAGLGGQSASRPLQIPLNIGPSRVSLHHGESGAGVDLGAVPGTQIQR